MGSSTHKTRAAHSAAYREMIERPFANKEPAAVVTDKRESEAGREGSVQGRGWL